tara:strand:+ start:385 stop:579 length:195 start_codon:yes stop_codon:yes gene_type:complete
MDRDINTIPTVPRHIVSYKILVEWSDNPELVELEYDMNGHLENTFNDWLVEIEEEENEDVPSNI